MRSTDTAVGKVELGREGVDPLQRLRREFHSRLHDEHRSLTRLIVQLIEPGGNQSDVRYAIRRLAHRVRGAAAIFQARAIECAADELEQIAMEGINGRTDVRDECLEGSMLALIELLREEQCKHQFAE